MNYYIILDNDEELQDVSLKYAAVGAAIGGGFNHTSKFISKNHKEARMGPDEDKWIELVLVGIVVCCLSGLQYDNDNDR